MHNQITQAEYSKLRWQCRRGVKELDVVLCRYLEKTYLQDSKENQQAFKKLLRLEDPLLLAWLLGEETPPDPQLKILIERIKVF